MLSCYRCRFWYLYFAMLTLLQYYCPSASTRPCYNSCASVLPCSFYCFSVVTFHLLPPYYHDATVLSIASLLFCSLLFLTFPCLCAAMLSLLSCYGCHDISAASVIRVTSDACKLPCRICYLCHAMLFLLPLCCYAACITSVLPSNDYTVTMVKL